MRRDYDKYGATAERPTLGGQQEALMDYIDDLNRQEEKIASSTFDRGSHLSPSHAEKPTAREAALRDAVIDLERDAGLDVIDDVEEEQRVLDMANDALLDKNKKRALETVSPNLNGTDHQTVIPSADGAKVLNNLDTLVKEYENSVYTKEKTFIGEVADSLGIPREKFKDKTGLAERQEVNADVQHGNGVRFFRTADGKQAYGFTVGGKIYIDPRIATSETPIHEYAHLWAEALRKANQKEWQNVVELMKECKAVWEQVKKEYPELKTDDEIAEDILNIHFTSAEEVADKVMYDLLNKVKPGNVNRADVSHGREDVEAVNKRFNEELAELTVENAQSKRLKLGSPSSMLSSAGVPDKPIILYGNKLLKKARLHGFEIEDLHDLPLAMQHPIAGFEGSHINSFATLLVLKLAGHNTLVSIVLR